MKAFLLLLILANGQAIPADTYTGESAQHDCQSDAQLWLLLASTLQHNHPLLKGSKCIPQPEEPQ